MTTSPRTAPGFAADSASRTRSRTCSSVRPCVCTPAMPWTVATHHPASSRSTIALYFFALFATSLSSNPLGSAQPLPPETRLEIALDRAQESRSEVLAGMKRDRREALAALHSQMRASLSHFDAPKRAQDPPQGARVHV